MTALLLYDEHAGDIAREAETVLSEDGLFITPRSAADITAEDATEAEALIVVRTANATTGLMFWAGYAAALKIPVLLIDDTGEVADPLKRWPRIDPTTKLWKPELCDRLRSLLGWNRPSAAGLHGDDLAHWVAEDLNRLEQLSATEYEELFATLFARFDCSVERKDAGLVLQDDRNGRRLFAHFKFAPTSDTIGITTIRDCVAAVARYECDFGVVVSNREFSPAARGFADEQSPAIWLASRDWFASVATAKFSGYKSADLVRLADDLRSHDVFTPLLLSSSSRTRNLPSLTPPSDAKRMPVQLVIVHYDDEEARDLEAYCSSFATLAYEYPLQCSRVDVRKNLRLRMRELFTAPAEHHVMFLDNGGSFGRQFRSRCYTALTSVARDLELRGRIGVIDDSPAWSQLCAPRSLDAVFVLRNRSAIEKWLKDVLGVRPDDHQGVTVDDGESTRRILATTAHFTGNLLSARRDQPSPSRDGDALRWFALAQAPEPFRLIKRDGAWYSMKSRNARRTDENPIRLGQGRASAYLAFQKNRGLVQEAEEWIDAVVSREGAERVIQILREYSTSLSKQMAAVAAEPQVKDQVEREIQAIESYVQSVETGG